MNSGTRHLGMVLKGYPRISESFISSEILLLEAMGIPIEIFSLRFPRESFSHDHVKHIQAPVTYLPEYVLPHWRRVIGHNIQVCRRMGSHYTRCLASALHRAVQRRKPATVRHFLQAGYLVSKRLNGSPVVHLHAHFCHTPASVALFASELTGLPFSFTAHAKDIYTSEPDQLARKIERARFVVTCTEYNARYLRSLIDHCEPHTPIHTVYHGIDLELFSFRGHPRPALPFLILSVGRLVPKKGYDDLLRALKKLEETGVDFRFVHIGSGELQRETRNLVSALELTGRVRMLGTLPHHEVLDWYRRAHCFALACKVAGNGDRDGIPNVLAEAMAVGVPVVTTRVSAIPELVEDSVTGILVDPGNPQAMATALHRLLHDPGRCAELALRARARVEKVFDKRRCTLQLQKLFRKALDRE